jgi:hypothetical protein
MCHFVHAYNLVNLYIFLKLAIFINKICVIIEQKPLFTTLNIVKCVKNLSFTSMFVFEVVTPCQLVGRQMFWRSILPPSSCLNWKWRQYVTPKVYWHLPARSHGVTTHKTNTNILTAMTTWNLVCHVVFLQFTVPSFKDILINYPPLIGSHCFNQQ